jgi:prepilin-type processing-associated H-X9-DG protein
MFLLIGRTGPSTDIVSGEIPSGNTPNALSAGPDCFWSQHPGGCQFLLCDGSVRSITQTVAPEIFRARHHEPAVKSSGLISIETKTA